MNLKLRPYQEECLESIHSYYSKGINRQLVQMATGAGKTVVFANLIAQKQCRTLVLANTCELLDQAKDKIQMICPDIEVGILKANRKELDKRVVISSIQSARQPETLAEFQKQEFSLCIYDESHHAPSSSSKHILSELGFLAPSNKLLVGFTATPFRTDNKCLGEIFKEVVYKKTIKDIISIGFLCKPIGIRISSDLDLSTVKTVNGDFVSTSLASVMNTSEMNDLVVNTYIEQANSRKTVCFCVTVSHAKNLAETFKNRGITSETIYGNMPMQERQNLLKRFQCGDISVLTNCNILTEGWDCPEVDCVLIAKPTQSKSLYQQMCGRGLRLFPNKKDCLILDFGSKTHSLCGTISLIEGQEEIKQEYTKGKISKFAKQLPPNINKKLKAAILEFDPLGEDFHWIKEGSSYCLKGIGNSLLKIFPATNGKFNAVLFGRNGSQAMVKEMTFEYAFSSAEEFAKTNRCLFAVSDLDAPWRGLEISDKQKDFLRSFGYRSGIDELSRGQAALIISSGVLRRKTLGL